MSTFEDEALVELTIPGKPEFVGVARLAVLGVASRMRFSYDEVEDVRLAVGEACATAIERANGAGRRSEIRIRCRMDSSKLVVEVCDLSAPAGSASAPIPDGSGSSDGPESSDEPSLGGILIRILMDDVNTVTDSEDGLRAVQMVKYVAPPREVRS